MKETELEKWAHTAELKLIVAKQEQENGGHFHTVAETGQGTEVHVLSFSDLRLEDLVKVVQVGVICCLFFCSVNVVRFFDCRIIFKMWL